MLAQIFASGMFFIVVAHVFFELSDSGLVAGIAAGSAATTLFYALKRTSLPL